VAGEAPCAYVSADCTRLYKPCSSNDLNALASFTMVGVGENAPFLASGGLPIAGLNVLHDLPAFFAGVRRGIPLG
jgi:hypothetical protein